MMSLLYKTSAMAVAAAIALTACTFGPNGAAPAMPSPAHYGAGAQPAKTAAAGGVAQQFDIGAVAVPQWWRLYRSDALSALVEEGLRNSPTLGATQRTLAAAQQELRAQVGASTLPSIDAAAQVERARSRLCPASAPPRFAITFLPDSFSRPTPSTCSVRRVRRTRPAPLA
jgi:outer membrane protein TolC